MLWCTRKRQVCCGVRARGRSALRCTRKRQVCCAVHARDKCVVLYRQKKQSKRQKCVVVCWQRDRSVLWCTGTRDRARDVNVLCSKTSFCKTPIALVTNAYVIGKKRGRLIINAIFQYVRTPYVQINEPGYTERLGRICHYRLHSTPQ